MPTSLRAAAGRAAATERWSGPEAPATLDARRDLRAAQLEQHIARVVAEAPPLTEHQRDRLATLLLNTPNVAPR